MKQKHFLELPINLLLPLGLMDVIHSHSISTSLSFALKAGYDNNLVLFGLAVGITGLLVVLERFTLWVSSPQHILASLSSTNLTHNFKI